MRLLSTILILIFLSFTSCIDQDTKISQIQKEVQAIDSYLNTSGIVNTSLVWYDQSGIRIVIQDFDNKTAPPTTGQTINASVTGKLFSDQTIFFDDVIEQRIENILTDGLRMGISVMMGGSTATIFVPSAYAYGKEGASNVPPNSIVIYEVTLNSVTKTTAQAAQFETDTTAIKEYLSENSISASFHESGIWYTIDEIGLGDIPIAYDYATFKYTLMDMADDGTVIQTGTLNDYFIFDLVDGLKIGLPILEENTKATFFLPSLYGYGVTGKGNIDPNTNLIFEIELLEVTPLNQ